MQIPGGNLLSILVNTTRISRKFTPALCCGVSAVVSPKGVVNTSACAWQGMKVQLDQDHLAFGAVVQHCQANKKIVMINSGDVGTR